ncbi:MAG: lysozyme inhibitor LprI family protein [Terracidiphilus sp.]|jgi:uncharacterized protein YecT (DUF1311 family)
MKSFTPRVALVAFCLVYPCCLHPQIAGQVAPSSDAAEAHAPDPDSGMGQHVEGLFIPLATGQPFHAKVDVQIVRQLPDGTTVAQKYYTLVARDGTGREYREGRDLVPADSDRDPPLMRTIVYDPKTSLITTCIPDRRVCRQSGFDPTGHPVDEPAGPSSDGKSVLTRESLGTKTIDGLEVQGTRETLTFNPGAFGNDKPVVVTKEIWYSPQLQFNLAVTRDDPRNGTQKFEVTDLKLGDPGPEWFALPDGYRMVQERMVADRMTGPAELEPLLEKSVSGMTPDELSTALAPVEAAIGAYAKAHAAASPNDRNDRFAGEVRSRLSMDLHMIQQIAQPPKAQFEDADLRLNQMYREVIDSPCLNKPQPGDPPSMPSSEATLREEERAWVALRDAWTAFLTKLFPNADPAGFAWMLTNERDQDLRRIQNVERNRGCMPEESIEPELERVVTGMTPEQLTEAVKPLDAAIGAYAKAHAAAAPNEHNEFFVRMVQQQLRGDLQMQEQGQVATQDQFEEADLHLNQAWRVVVASPCLSKPIPGDPPNAPVSEDALRAEERAWIAMRDAWTAFLATVFPTAGHGGFGTTLTDERANDLRQIQNVERNRGCVPAE